MKQIQILVGKETSENVKKALKDLSISWKIEGIKINENYIDTMSEILS